MADLDEKLLKSLDDRIKQMNGSLLQLASTVDVLKRESKGWISSLINEFNAGSLKDLLGVNEARKNISAVKADLKSLKDTINSGTLTPEKERAAINIYAEKRKELNNLMMSDEQIAKRILQIVNKMTSVMTPQQRALQQQQEAYRKILNIQQEIQRIRNRQSERGARGLVVDKATVDAEVALIKRLEAEMRVLKRERTALAKESGVSNSTKLSKGDYAQSLEYQRQLTRETVRHGEALERIKQHQKEVKSGFERMLPTLRRLAAAFGVAFSVRGLVNFGRKLVETRGEFEMQFVAMKQIIGDVDAATKIWNQTMQQALQSPFRAMQLVDYTKKLAAYRIETDKLFDTTKRLADVSAGLGVDMGRLILAYGQVKSANFLRASEVRQFTEAGVNIYDNLANYFSEIEGRAITVSEVIDRVTKRMVLFSDVEEIFKRMTDEGGVFFNMQEVQADTVRGQIMKLHDAYDQMLNTIGQANQGTLRNLTETANRLVRNWRDVAAFLKAQVPLFAVMIPYWVSMRKIQSMTAEESALLASRLATLKTSFLSTTKSTKSATLALHEQRAAMMRQRKEMALNIERIKRLVNNKELLTRATRMWTRSMKTSMIQSAAFDTVLKSLIVSGEMLKSTLRSIAPFLAIEGIIFLVNSLSSASRKAAEFKKELRELTDEQMGRGDEEANEYKRLIKELEATNEGSIERAKVIQKINDKYGVYLDNLYNESSSLEDVANGYEVVAERAKEAARARALEEGYSKILGKYNQERSDSIFDLAKHPHGYSGGFGKAGTFLSVGGTFDISKDDAKGFSEYVDEIVEKNEELYASMSQVERQKAIRQLYKDYFGKELPAGAAQLFNFIDNTVDRLAALKDYEQSLEKDFNLKGLNKELRDTIIGIRDDAKELISQIEGAKRGDSIILPIGMKLDIKKTRDDADTDVNSILTYIKRRVEEQSKQKEIDLRLSSGIIGEEEAKKLRDRIGRLTDETANQINDKIIKQIKEAYNVTGDLLDYIEKNPWDKNMGEMFAAINSGLITQNDIVQGIGKAEEVIQGRLQGQLSVLQDINKKKNSGLITDKAQLDALLKQERSVQTTYQWLQKTLFLLKNRAEVSEVQSALLDNTTIDKAKERVRKKFGENVANDIKIGYAFDYANINMVQSAVADAYHKAGDEIDKEIKSIKASANADKEKIKMLERQRDIQYELANAYGYVDQKARSGGQKESVSRLISLIKEMRSEYDKLSKSAYGYAKSEEKVRTSFAKSYEAILKEAGVPENFDFSTNAGEIAALERVRDYVKGNAKFAKDAWKDVQKVIDQLKTESEIEVQVRIREDFGRHVEEAFGNYELTLELQKLNLPSDVLSDLFDLETVDLSDLRNRIAKFYEDQVAIGADPTELVKQVEGYYKKIDNMERKQQQQRIKDYAKYLEYEMSERAKIEMEYVRKVGEVMANTAFKTERKEAIKKRLQDERDKAIAKQDWEDFKGSETYVQMMEDLEGHGVAALQAMRVELEKVRENAENLSPRALKEVVNAIEKIRKIELQKQNPFKRLSEAQADLKTAREEAEKAGIDPNMSRKELSNEEALTRTTLMEREKAFNVMQKQIGAQKELNDYEKDRIKLEKKFSTEKYGYDISKVATGSVDDTADSNTLYGKILAQEDKVKAKTNEIAANREQILDTQKKLVVEQAKGEKADKAKVQLYSDQIEMLDNLYPGLKTELETLQAEKGQLEEILRLRISEEEAKLSAKDISDDERKALEKEISDLKEKLRLLGVIVDKTKEQDDAWKNIASKISQVASELSNVYNSFKGMMDSFGVDMETGGWADADAAMTTVGALGNVASKIASGDWIGAAFAAVSGIFESIAAWNKASDAHLDDIIKSEQKRIESLQDAYARLERQIEKTWSSVSYMQTYEQQVQNKREQIDAMEAQMRAEEAKKNTDDNAVRQYQRDIQDAYDQLDELDQKSIEVFGGIGEEGYRSAAEGFVEAWKSAFLETGDGLQGLQDHFNEFLQDWFVKQGTMQAVADYYSKVWDYVNGVVKDGGLPTQAEIEQARALADEAAVQSDAFLQAIAGIFNLHGEGSLSGLAAGIQGMTEEQANILEAYWNSVRMYNASMDMNIARIVAILENGNFMSDRRTLEDGMVVIPKGSQTIDTSSVTPYLSQIVVALTTPNVETNPMLRQMSLIAANTHATHQLLQSVTRSGHSLGGYGIKVFND